MRLQNRMRRALAAIVPSWPPLNRLACAVAALLSCALAGGARAGCVSQPYSYGPGIRSVTVVLYVAADTDCIGQLSPPAGLEIVGIDVVRRPRNGVAGVSGVTSAAYKPKPGFVGDDRMSARVRFRVNGAPGATMIHYEVKVVRQ